MHEACTESTEGKEQKLASHKKRREQRSGTTQADIFAYSAAVLRNEA